MEGARILRFNASLKNNLKIFIRQIQVTSNEPIENLAAILYTR